MVWQRFFFYICRPEKMFTNTCPGGEIGRRTAFRWQRSQGCAGSNPVLGTTFTFLKALIALAFKAFSLGNDVTFIDLSIFKNLSILYPNGYNFTLKHIFYTRTGII